MECFYCKGEMTAGAVTHFVQRKGYRLILEEVPAQVCGQYGEHLFGRVSVDLIQGMIQDLDEKIQAVVTAPGAAIPPDHVHA